MLSHFLSHACTPPMHLRTHTNKTHNNTKQTKHPDSQTVQNGLELFLPLQLQAWLLGLIPDSAGLECMRISLSFFVDSLSHTSFGVLVSFYGSIFVLSQLVFYLSCYNSLHISLVTVTTHSE